MYKIYINETPLFLTETPDNPKGLDSRAATLKAFYAGKPKYLLHYVDMLEKTRQYDAVQLYHPNLKKLKKDFKTLFKKIDAAGGLVLNSKKEILFIFRRGYWDLPKGKIDEGEGKKAAAIREVQEETGIQHLHIEKKLLKTYHTYRDTTGKRILKKTHWYQMTTPDEVLIPQTEEDIEQAIWKTKASFLAENPIVYKNIVEVLQKARIKKHA